MMVGKKNESVWDERVAKDRPPARSRPKFPWQVHPVEDLPAAVEEDTTSVPISRAADDNPSVMNAHEAASAIVAPAIATPLLEAIPTRESDQLSEANRKPDFDSKTLITAAQSNSKTSKSNIPSQNNIPSQTSAIYPENIMPSQGNMPSQSNINTFGIVKEQFTAIPNGILDRVFPTLDAYSQVVLLRLYRLSHGFHSNQCKVSFSGLVKSCGISKSQIQRALQKLEDFGFIERSGYELRGFYGKNKGTIFTVNLPSAVLPRQGKLPPQTIIPSQTNVPSQTSNKEHIKRNTHKHSDPENLGVRVDKLKGVPKSSYSLEECRKYAAHLRASGEGINNPGGYATAIHRSGEADTLIGVFFAPTNPTVEIDTSHCPDCQGTGYWYPQGNDKGVARCKHAGISHPPKSS